MDPHIPAFFPLEMFETMQFEGLAVAAVFSTAVLSLDDDLLIEVFPHRFGPLTQYDGKGDLLSVSFDNDAHRIARLFVLQMPEQAVGLGDIHAIDTDNDIAWKSLGVTRSYDNGVSWIVGEQIITSDIPKPENPEWGGSGDNSVIWDWKTSSRAYNESEKQKKAHQPTVYCAAAVSTGLAEGTEQTFRFGVMVRQQSPKSQVVEVTRTRAHYDFLHRQAKAAVDQAVISSGQRDWFMNDQHVLCSSTWCDYWSICKGSHIP